MRNIVIYRHQLFQPSEGFIFQQTKYLTQHNPIFTGRTINGPYPIQPIHIKTLDPISRIDLARHILLRNNDRLHQQLILDKPALVHAHFGVEGVYALPLAKKLDIPLITTFHGFDATCNRKGLLFSGKISWMNYLAHRPKLARHGDLFICISDFIRKRLLQLGFPNERTVTHYIGVDTDSIKTLAEKKSEKIILHVARLVEKKGTHVLLKAFSQLQMQDQDTKLVIIGDGPLRHSLQAYATTLNIASRVQFLGVQPSSEVISWMQKSSIFCLPSMEAQSGDSEGLGIVFLEAAACQLPIVATLHGGIPEAVKDNQTGFLVPENDANTLAEKLAYLVKNESICENIGKAGRDFVERNFNLKRQTEKLERIYQSVTK